METSEDVGGYNYRFVDQLPEHYMCMICHQPSRDPYMTGECCQGQTMCKSCLDQAIRVSNSCPCCRSEENFSTYPNWRFKREINNLHVYCTNKDKGCEWTGELINIKDHLGSSDGCQFEDIRCFNMCGMMIQRQHLTSHVESECVRRKVNCCYCDVTGEHQFIEGPHMEEFPRLPLPCPNNCENAIPREDMAKHRKECCLELIYCLNKCGKKFERWCLTSHVEDECPCRQVNCQYCEETGEYQFIDGDHKEECPEFPLPCPNNCEANSVPRASMEAHRKECPLEMVQCKYCSVGCEAVIARKDQEKHENDKMKSHLLKSMVELTSVKCDLDNTNHKLNNTELELTNTKRELASTKLLLADLTSHLSNAMQQIRTMEALMYLTMDRAIIWPTSRATIMMSSAKWPNKLAAMAVLSKSGNQECPVILKMNEFNKHYNNRCYSDSFYTHEKGFKMCLGMDFAGNGQGKGTHLSWFLYFMKGICDDHLTWPFRGKLEIKLLNQINDSQHHSMTMTYDDETPDHCASRVVGRGNMCARGWGMAQFITNENLYKADFSCQYLKDDCLFFQVTKL